MIKDIDGIADLRCTVEFDHTLIDSRLKYVGFPFDCSILPKPTYQNYNTLRIGHAPSKRQMKGTNEILQALKALKQRYEFDIILIENLPHKKALDLKSSCHIFIDQLTEIGYGINALESLGLGIPTCTSLIKEFEITYSDHPFVNIDNSNINHKLSSIIESISLRNNLSARGKIWVEDNHNFIKITKTIHANINLN